MGKMLSGGAKRGNRAGIKLPKLSAGPVRDSGDPWTTPERQVEVQNQATVGKRFSQQLRKNKSSGLKPPR